MSWAVFKGKFVAYAGSRTRVHEYCSWKQNHDLAERIFTFPNVV